MVSKSGICFTASDIDEGKFCFTFSKVSLKFFLFQLGSKPCTTVYVEKDKFKKFQSALEKYEKHNRDKTQLGRFVQKIDDMKPVLQPIYL